jgi:uracil-DNA glycosylase
LPGRAPSARGDRTPTPREQELCSFWREWEFKLLRPRLILAVGGLSARRLLGLKNLAGCIGERFEYGEAAVVPLPHPSGRSTWLNAPDNRALLGRAIDLVRAELARLET